MDILVISLPSAKDRRIFQQEQLTKLKLDFEFLKATTTTDISKNSYKKHYYDWQRPLRKTEVACYYSHRNAWEKIIKSNNPSLILEDDALLSKCITELLESLSTKENVDLINLENRGRKKFISRSYESIECSSKIFKLYQDRTGAAGYILWPSGAKKLIDHERRKGIALADAHITDCHTLQAFQVEPSPIIQLDYCEYYQIKNPINTSAIKSTVSSYNNTSGGARFIVKKLLKQLQLGIRQLGLIFISTRRYIKIRTQDFN